MTAHQVSLTFIAIALAIYAIGGLIVIIGAAVKQPSKEQS